MSSDKKNGKKRHPTKGCFCAPQVSQIQENHVTKKKICLLTWIAGRFCHTLLVHSVTARCCASEGSSPEGKSDKDKSGIQIDPVEILVSFLFIDKLWTLQWSNSMKILQKGENQCSCQLFTRASPVDFDFWSLVRRRSKLFTREFSLCVPFSAKKKH